MYATWSDLPSDTSTKGMTRLLPPNGNISSVTELKVKLGLDNAVMPEVGRMEAYVHSRWHDFPQNKSNAQCDA